MTGRVLHIVFLNQYYAPFTASTSHLLTDAATHLAALGHRITVITGRSAYIPEECTLDAPKRQKLNGVDVIRVGNVYADRASKVRRVYGYGMYLLSAMRALLRQERPDVVVSLTTPPFLVAAAVLPAKWKRARLLLWLMDMYPDALAADRMLNEKGILYRLMSLLSRISYRACSRIIVLDDYMRERLAVSGVEPKRLTVCSNWEPSVDALQPQDTSHREFRKELGIAESDFVLLYLGNLGRAHDVDTLVAAMEQLRDRSQIKFVFVGGGTRIQELRKAVRDRNLPNTILRPAVSKASIALPLRAADAGIVTLLPAWNGILSPSKVHSLLAFGLPILYIGPERSAVADIVREGPAGSVHALGDVSGVVATILEWSARPDRARAAGSRARALFERSFTRDVGVARLTEALLSTI